MAKEICINMTATELIKLLKKYRDTENYVHLVVEDDAVTEVSCADSDGEIDRFNVRQLKVVR